MACDVEFTDEFGDWWDRLTAAEQASVRDAPTPNYRGSAVLLIGGDKTGDDRWYETFVPLADRVYDRHLEQLKQEGEI